MSESEQKSVTSRAYTEQGTVGYYVYCIAENNHAAKILRRDPTPSAIEENVPLELITVENLAAVASKVPLSVFGAEAIDAHLSDAPWVTVRAMRHEQVVEHFARQTSVVPLRFGTIYLDVAGIEQMLEERHDQLCGLIERIRGREEWGVNLYLDRAVLLENITNISPRLREMADTAKAASPGQSYLMQKKIEAMRVDESKREVERVTRRVEEQLVPCSDGVSRLRVLKVETTEHGELKAKFAFLVLKGRFEDFKATAEDVARDIEGAGFRIELTGPWPAYNFATL